ncbi:hypothetical protein PR202_gb27171 [Eleusine coracana subsp. coracana]|uniref:GDSL esterase/lipase n=1 Tax=Eleusine coracana subsp. coracana TaxID=191504 RepID=A0AAV5FUM7_ELECO|nr:hypothetical protein PR202_gb27171 [Eleusine coracana subsp. coracana]
MDNKLFLPCAAIVSLFLLLLLRWSEPVAGAASTSLRVRRPYDSIFSFGDSFTDTGNNPVVFDWYSIFDPVLRPPYGSTFFNRPTGRNCDGRLIIDFLAQSLGLPFVPPFLAHNGSFRRGANFAVGGATALDAGFFHDGELSEPTRCLSTQAYLILLVGGRSMPQVTSLVPDVIATISMATERLIEHGATSLVVPGVLPVGCAPPNLVMFEGIAEPAAYDPKTGCLIELNELSAYHNSLLRQALHDLQAKHPDVEIIYIDFFGPVMEMVESPAKFGFEGDVLTICCGGPGNKYHFSTEAWCGDPAATECKDPSARLFWDGVHMTEAANRYIAGEWLCSIDTPASVSSQ